MEEPAPAEAPVEAPAYAPAEAPAQEAPRYERERGNAPLSPAERGDLALHELAADYRATLQEATRIDAVIERLDAMRARADVQPRERALCGLWLADLHLRRGRLDRAAELLTDPRVAANGRNDN